MSDYPTRDFTIIQPSIVETQLTGWIATVQFTRRDHQYEVKLTDNRMARWSVSCLRDGKPIAWHAVNLQAMAVVNEAVKWLKAAQTIAGVAK